MIKGFRKTMWVYNTGKTEKDVRVNALVVRCLEEAEALKRCFGDKSSKKDRAERDKALIEKVMANAALFDAIIPAVVMEEGPQKFPSIPIDAMRKALVETLIRDVPEARARAASW